MRVRPALSALIASLAEMATPANRHRVRAGIWSGYAVAVGFAILAVVTSAFELTPWRWAYFVLVAGKLVTNTVAWIAVARERAILATKAVTAADVVLLTAAIYFTGGPHSPVLASYVIEIAVLSLLSNLAVTIVMVAFVLVCFSTMIILMAAGVLPPQPVPGSPGEVPSIGLAI